MNIYKYHQCNQTYHSYYCKDVKFTVLDARDLVPLAELGMLRSCSIKCSTESIVGHAASLVSLLPHSSFASREADAKPLTKLVFLAFGLRDDGIGNASAP